MQKFVGWLAVCASGMGFCLGVSPSESIAAETTAPAALKGPLEPSQSLRTFALDPELQIELVAAEPEVIDPVAVHFGADGKLWVVEMRDYPHGPAAGSPPSSRIKMLFDHDGDGRYETAQVFADQLLFVTGVLPYRDGVIVTMAGQVAFFADRDGDGVAEFRETWFSGFAQENSQLRANHPTYGPDGYVYIANGLRGGKVVAERPEWKSSREPLTISGFDFRFHPETGDFGTVTGHGQFGLTFDSYGHQFVCSNRNPCSQVMLDDRYLKQNPFYGPQQVMHDVCAAGENSRLYPISQAWTTSTLHANQFTAACGVTIYRGDALPTGYHGNAFTCDPTGNLVHREVLSNSGATFAGESPYAHREFLASPDTWFRPVNLAHGPDGSLYVVDMYRAVIEHPDFMPEELKTRPDLLLGTDRGRIYRVTSKSKTTTAPTSLAKASADELIQALVSTNGWTRDTASRRIFEGHATADLTALRALLAQDLSAESRVTVLQLIQQLGQLTPADVLTAMSDADANVREVAVRISEFHRDSPEVRNQWLALVADENARVRFQAVESLSLLPVDDSLTAALLKVTLQDATDPWMRSAILTTVRDQAPNLLAQVLTALSPSESSEVVGIALQDLAAISGAERFDAVRGSIWQSLAAPVWAESDNVTRSLRWSVLLGLQQGLASRGKALLTDPALPDELAARLNSWLQEASTVAMDAAVPAELRMTAIQLMRLQRDAATAEQLLSLALEDRDVTIQQAALDALAFSPSADIAQPLLDQFASASPAVRRGILDVLLAQEARTELLLAALEQGQIQPTEIDPVRVPRLTKHRNAAIRNRAVTILEAAFAQRSQVLADYQTALTLTSDPQRGRLLFEKHCVTCHRVGERGVNVGPDIADTRTKTPDVLLTAILDPNRAVDNNYFGYTVTTTAGKVMTGIISAETSAAITLRQPEGKTETILRSDIEELRNTGMSLMPVGFEKNLSKAEMADLLNFLKNWRYLDGAVPVGK
ncbi:c-type cytochrome [bacterium]|nr:c-type cytochrome [bacterium]